MLRGVGCDVTCGEKVSCAVSDISGTVLLCVITKLNVIVMYEVGFHLPKCILMYVTCIGCVSVYGN